MRTNYVQRFVNNAAAVTQRAITNIDLFDLKFVASSATAGYRIIGGVKLNYIEVWSANASGSAINTIEVELVTSNPYFGSTSKIFSDCAIGTANVAHVKAKPAKDSFTGSWLPNNSANIFTVANLTLPIGSIVDVNMTIEFIDEENATLVSGAVASATTGKLYTRPLDSTNVGPRILPIGTSYA